MSSSQEDSFFDKTLKSSATFLGRWQGVHAELRELTSSHKTLRILLSRIGQKGNLLIACIDPIRLRGPVRWENSQIAISRCPLPGEPGDGFAIIDPTADVEILCGHIEVKENVKLD